MSESELVARATRRLIYMALCLGALCTAAILVTLRADAQSQAHGAPQAVVAPPPAPPAKAEDPARTDAAITDDATIAPDPHESADNNVSFPVDI